jgi:hypothetical protein
MESPPEQLQCTDHEQVNTVTAVRAKVTVAKDAIRCSESVTCPSPLRRHLLTLRHRRLSASTCLPQLLQLSLSRTMLVAVASMTLRPKE